MNELLEYTVKPGDTLDVLAKRLIGPEAGYMDLLSFNPQIANPDVIRVGETIFYPSSEQTTSSSSGNGLDIIGIAKEYWFVPLAAAIVGAAIFKARK